MRSSSSKSFPANATDISHAKFTDALSSSILLVHLSDLHIKALQAQNQVLERARAIADAIAAEAELQGPSLCIIAVTGDVAFSGLTVEYDLASLLVKEVAALLADRLTCKVHIAIVPGNHDCDFTAEDSVRRSLLQKLASGDIDASIIRACAAIQAPFFEFATRLKAGWDGPAAAVTRIRVTDRDVALVQLNTAWCSSLSEKPGELMFPCALIPDAGDSDIVIAMFHHPYAWLRNDNARSLREYIETHADIVLTGHEHVPGSYQKRRLSGEHNEYIEGGALQDPADPDLSSFNAIVIDLASKTQRSYLFRWQPAERLYANSQSAGPREFHRNQSAIRRQFQIRENFQTYLDEPGEPFKHPRKLVLKLSDIFVSPQLSAASSDGDALIPSLLPLIKKKKRVLICGAELSGKTTLAKKLFETLTRDGLIPLLIDGAKISAETMQDLESLRTTAFLHCYEPPGLERFRQLDASHRALIIDDVQASPLAIDLLEQAIQRLERAFAYVVVFGGEDFSLELIESLRPGHASLLEYERLNIQPFGHRLRYDLVEKWCFIGRDTSEDLSAISARVLRLDQLVTGVIGTNLLPSLPSFVLLCLQQLDGTDTRATMGSFGHLYEALITQNLNSGGAPRSEVDVDSKRRFLSHFAYELFTAQRPSLSLGEWDDAFTRYTARYDVTFPRSAFLKETLDTRLLEQSAGKVEFRYPYAYCFFVAEYMQTNLADASVQAAARQLCEQLHHEESANILLFLSHLSRDNIVLDLLLQRARSFFPDAPPFDLQERLKPLGVSKRINKLTVPGPDPEFRRRQEREERDNAERIVGNDVEPLPDKLQGYFAALKTIQLIGQVLRSYPGSMEAERKVELLRVCYDLGMRAVATAIGYVIDGHEEIVDALAEVLVKKRPELHRDLQRVKSEVKTFIVRLCEGAFYGAILHVSDSVGLAALKKSYDRLAVANPDIIPYELINLAVSLDHFDGFPHEQLQSLERRFSKTSALHNVLRRLVWRHVYLFPVKYQLRQSLCSKFEIRGAQVLMNPATKRVSPVAGKRSRKRRK